jgi:fatty acid desaturase
MKNFLKILLDVFIIFAILLSSAIIGWIVVFGNSIIPFTIVMALIAVIVFGLNHFFKWIEL